jgi:hypothetical protein
LQKEEEEEAKGVAAGAASVAISMASSGNPYPHKEGIHPNNNSLMGILLLKVPEAPPHLPFFSLSLLGLSLVVEYLSIYLSIFIG